MRDNLIKARSDVILRVQIGSLGEALREVAVPKGPPPAWRQRKQPVLDDHLRVSLAWPMNPDTGFYGQCEYAGLKSRDEAQEIIRGLHRSARYLKCSVSAKIKAKADGTYSVAYSAVNKSHARAYILAKYGNDRSTWESQGGYDPRAKARK